TPCIVLTSYILLFELKDNLNNGNELLLRSRWCLDSQKLVTSRCPFPFSGWSGLVPVQSPFEGTNHFKDPSTACATLHGAFGGYSFPPFRTPRVLFCVPIRKKLPFPLLSRTPGVLLRSFSLLAAWSGCSLRFVSGLPGIYFLRLGSGRISLTVPSGVVRPCDGGCWAGNASSLDDITLGVDCIGIVALIFLSIRFLLFGVTQAVSQSLPVSFQRKYVRISRAISQVIISWDSLRGPRACTKRGMTNRYPLFRRQA
ncbi:unnamed protein product, partial [Sphacelaria rigidula]